MKIHKFTIVNKPKKHCFVSIKCVLNNTDYFKVIIIAFFDDFSAFT